MMKLAGPRRRAFLALAGLVAAYGAPARAADDKSTVSSVMELVGVSSDPTAASIDYRERPKLVLPPRTGELPPPREGAERPGGWPVDAATARHRNSDRYARVQGAVQEERKPGFFERFAGAKSDAPAIDEPSRRMLTEPPAGYRRPTKDVRDAYDPDAKKSSWWNPLSYIGGGADDGPSNPAAPDMRGGGGGRRLDGPARNARGGDGNLNPAANDTRDGGLLSGLDLTHFVRGSSDNN